MGWFRRVTNVFRSQKVSTELDAELSFHLAERADELMARGMSRDEARREAARQFGRYVVRREETGDVDIARSLEAFLGDVRYGARQLRLNPGFTTVAVLSLALGIGANCAIFQLINALRLRSLPVEEAGQLAAVETGPDFFSAGWFQGRNSRFTYAQLEQMLIHQQAFSGLLAFNTTRFNLSPGGEAHYVEGLYVTPNFLDVLGVAPALGRWLPPNTDPKDCSDAGALLNYGFWQREYNGDATVLGRDITLDGRSFPILGVAPASFFGLEPARRFDVAVPLCADGLFAEDGQGRLANMTAWWLTPIGRLKPGWSVERASAHMRQISPTIFRASQPEAYRPDAVEKYLANTLEVASARAGVSGVRRNYENPLWILLASSGLVLLGACANLANLLLARGSAREREVALRQAMGASRTRLVAQLMSESLLLVGFGAALGALLAYALTRWLVLLVGGDNLEVSLGFDWRVVAFTAALAVGTCLLFGLAPALRATSGAPADAMRGGRGSTSSSAERHGLRRALVVSQIALSFVLLVGALLFGQSLRNLLMTETGIEAEGVLVARISAELPDLEPAHRLRVFQQLNERIRGLPDVTDVAAARFGLFSGSGWSERVHGDDEGASAEGTIAWLNRVSPGYFRTLKTPLLAGRDFTPHDDAKAPRVAIANERFA